MFQGVFCDFTSKKDESRMEVFVSIGKDLAHDFYRDIFKACCEDEEMNFLVGS